MKIIVVLKKPQNSSGMSGFCYSHWAGNMADCITTIIPAAFTACMGYLSYKAVCIFLARSLILDPCI